MPRTLPPAPCSRRARAGALALAAATLLPLGACADLRRATGSAAQGVNVESPTAPAVLAATRARLVTPSFRDVPPAPRNTPSAAAIKTRVLAQVGERERLEGWVAAHPAGATDQEGFARASRALAAEGGAAPVEDHTAAAESWAAQARQAAAPPPPMPGSGP